MLYIFIAIVLSTLFSAKFDAGVKIQYTSEAVSSIRWTLYEGNVPKRELPFLGRRCI